MTFNEVLRHFGSQAAIARALNISEQAVSRYAAQDRIPTGRQYELQVLTGGIFAPFRLTRRAARIPASGRIRPYAQVKNNYQANNKFVIAPIDKPINAPSVPTVDAARRFLDRKPGRPLPETSP